MAVYDMNAWRAADNARMNQMPVTMGQNQNKTGVLMDADTTRDLPAQPLINKGKQAVGEAIYNARTPSGEDAGAIPTPDTPAQTATDSESNPSGALYPTNPAFNPKGSLPTDNATVVDPNSQAAGAQAQSEQDAHLDQTKQKLATDATKGGGVPTPITKDDPAAALASRNQNIQAGVGHAITGVNQPPVPAPLTDSQQKNVLLDKTGHESFKSMNTIGDWFQSRSFLMGMMQTGLSLLDGKGYAESFATGSKYFDDHYGMEQRTAWADDLLNKGYDRQEIQQYVETGDAKVLTSPEQRAFKQQQQQMQMQQGQQQLSLGAVNLEHAQYENSPEQRAAERQDRDINNAYKQNQMQYQTAQLQQQQEKSAYDNSPEQRDLERRYKESQIQQNQAQTQKIGMAGQTGGVNVVTVPGKTTPDGQPLKVTISGAEVLPGFYPMVDSKNKVQGDGRWMKTINPQTGVQKQVPINMQTYHIAAENADNAISQLNDFSKQQGGMFGPTGDIKREFFDAIGQRSTEDLGQMAETLQGLTGNLAISRATLDSGGFAPKDSELEMARNSFPTFGHRDPKTDEFIPRKMSREQFAKNVAILGKQAAQMREFAHQYNTQEGNDRADAGQYQVYQGQRRKDPKSGKWFVAAQSGDLRGNIWAVDPNQGD